MLTLVSNRDEKIVDLAAFAQQIRSQYGWPSQGSTLGHPSASEESDFVLTRIEDLGGQVPFREAIFLQAVLEDGPEAYYLKERQRRGYPSLFENEARLGWSSDPGFHERQLQIRHNNVFFPPPKRRVSRHDLYIARQIDTEDRSEFLEQWKRCLEEIVRGADFTPASKVADHLHAMYALLENAASIGAENTEQAKQIHKAYNTTLTAIYQALTDNPEATQALRSAEETRWSGSGFVLNPRLRRISRIADGDDIIPTMLSEDLETIRAMVKTLDAGRRGAVQTTVLQIINQYPEAREALRKQPQKLEALGLGVGAVDGADRR